jgi:hypothetical protein
MVLISAASKQIIVLWHGNNCISEYITSVNRVHPDNIWFKITMIQTESNDVQTQLELEGEEGAHHRQQRCQRAAEVERRPHRAADVERWPRRATEANGVSSRRGSTGRAAAPEEWRTSLGGAVPTVGERRTVAAGQNPSAAYRSRCKAVQVKPRLLFFPSKWSLWSGTCCNYNQNCGTILCTGSACKRRSSENWSDLVSKITHRANFSMEISPIKMESSLGFNCPWPRSRSRSPKELSLTSVVWCDTSQTYL